MVITAYHCVINNLSEALNIGNDIISGFSKIVTFYCTFKCLNLSRNECQQYYKKLTLENKQDEYIMHNLLADVKYKGET